MNNRRQNRKKAKNDKHLLKNEINKWEKKQIVVKKKKRPIKTNKIVEKREREKKYSKIFRINMKPAETIKSYPLLKKNLTKMTVTKMKENKATTRGLLCSTHFSDFCRIGRMEVQGFN